MINKNFLTNHNQNFKMQDSNKPKLPLVTLIAGTITILIIIVSLFYFYNSSKDKTEGEVIIISADNEEIKINPADPGGMVVDNMDRVIYDTLDSYNKTSSLEEQVKILQPNEEPLSKQELLSNTENKEEAKSVEGVAQEVKKETNIETVKKEESVNSEEYLKPVVKPETKKKTLDIIKKMEKSYKLQLASFKSKNDVEKEWSNLSKRFPKQLSGLKHFIVSKNIEGKGIFYRLQVGPFENEEEALRKCRSFKNAGINCFPVKP